MAWCNTNFRFTGDKQELSRRLQALPEYRRLYIETLELPFSKILWDEWHENKAKWRKRFPKATPNNTRPWLITGEHDNDAFDFEFMSRDYLLSSILAEEVPNLQHIIWNQPATLPLNGQPTTVCLWRFLTYFELPHLSIRAGVSTLPILEYVDAFLPALTWERLNEYTVSPQELSTEGTDPNATSRTYTVSLESEDGPGSRTIKISAILDPTVPSPTSSTTETSQSPDLTVDEPPASGEEQPAPAPTTTETSQALDPTEDVPPTSNDEQPTPTATETSKSLDPAVDVPQTSGEQQPTPTSTEVNQSTNPVEEATTTFGNLSLSKTTNQSANPVEEATTTLGKLSLSRTTASM